jgi:hypothetical protein
MALILDSIPKAMEANEKMPCLDLQFMKIKGRVNL